MSIEANRTRLSEMLRQMSADGASGADKYRAYQYFLSMAAAEKKVPIMGLFELTPLCNLDCKMCYVHLQKDQMNGAPLLSVDQWKAIMKQAADAGMLHATLTGGECFTYPGFKELYLYLRDCGIMEINILTNGVLVTDDMVDFLCNHKPRAIQVSVYGASEDAYERVTGHRAFCRVMNNIRKMRDAGLRVQTVITPNAYMTDGADIIRLMHEEGFKCSVNSGLSMPRKETGRNLEASDIAEEVALHKLSCRLQGKYIGQQCEMEHLPEPGGEQEERTVGALCSAGRRFFAIDWRGGMRPCTTFNCEAQSVPELGFVQAWERTVHTAENYPQPVECQGCSYKKVCVICMAQHAAGAEIGHANPRICAWVRQMVAEGLFSLQ